MYKIFPKVKSSYFYDNIINLTKNLSINLDKKFEENKFFSPIESIHSILLGEINGTTKIDIIYAELGKEEYQIQIDDNGIKLIAKNLSGIFYSLETIKQLKAQSKNSLPYCQIKDTPSIKTRGILLDIGRDKIPKLETLFMLIDMFASMKINHLQLYMEGYSFQYKKYEYLFSDETPITKEEYIMLENYAKSKFIDLVPNQNVLGHMEKWLEKPQFNSIAECPNGFKFENVYTRPPMTLDPTDDKSIEFAKYLLGELIDISTSEYINVNLDEPFELGHGKSKDIAKSLGKDKLYFNFADKINNYCKNSNKKIMMWGDQIFKNNSYDWIKSENILVLDWMYEGEGNFEEHAKKLNELQLNFFLCPGTSSWASFTGRYDNMYANIKNACECVIKYNGKGVLLTDWGDLGHWQYISTSYTAFAAMAEFSWSNEDDEENIKWYCNQFIYDSTDDIFTLSKALGNYYKLEKSPLYSTTLSFSIISSKYKFNTVDEFEEIMKRMFVLARNLGEIFNIPEKPMTINMNFEEIISYMNNLEAEITKKDINALIKNEMLLSIKFIIHGLTVYECFNNFNQDKTKTIMTLAELKNNLDLILKDHYNLWIARNKSGGFARSTKHLLHMMNLYTNSLNKLTDNSI